MIEDKNREPQLNEHEEQEIDLLELAQKVWTGRMTIIKTCAVAAVVGVVVAFSIPKEYTTTVKLAPESTKKAGGMGALAAMAGINLSSGSEGDAFSPELYPDIVKSVPFITDLFHIEVKDAKSKIDTTLYGYMEEYQKGPWWGAVTAAPFKLLGWGISLFKEKEPIVAGKAVDPFQLSQKEWGVVNGISNRIGVSVDKKSGAVTVDVTMQDALISATVADSVVAQLQAYVTNYRTNKARQDLAYSEELYTEAQQNYYAAQQKYAEYADGNQNVVLRSFRTESERLQNEMTLAYTLYNQVAQQLQMAKAKVMEITPVYAVVQPATVPLKPAKPNKPMMLIGFVFLGFVGSAGWILFGKELWAKLRKKD